MTSTEERARLYEEAGRRQLEPCPVCGETGCHDPQHQPPEVGRSNGRARDAGPACAHELDAHAVCSRCGLAFGLDVEALHDATAAAARGRQIAEDGIPYVLEGIIPALGMLGMLVAYAKTGKTSLGMAMGAAVSAGAPFLGRETRRSRVLYIAAEDPPEYVDWLARHLATEPGAMTLYERSIVLSDDGLARISATVKAGGYGLVLIASWQAVIRGLVRDENDNAGAVGVVERVKLVARQTGIPWLIDAHSGRGEDQSDDADPVKALRGASAAAGAADYLLSLRYDGSGSTFGTRRRFSGRGRFVTLATECIDFDPATGTYDRLGSAKDAARESTWELIRESGALTREEQTAAAIARACGLAEVGTKVGGQTLRHIHEALRGRDGVTRSTSRYRGRDMTVYALTPEEPEA